MFPFCGVRALDGDEVLDNAAAAHDLLPRPTAVSDWTDLRARELWDGLLAILPGYVAPKGPEACPTRKGRSGSCGSDLAKLRALAAGFLGNPWRAGRVDAAMRDIWAEDDEDDEA
jgi:hypothetical protein